MPYLFVYGTLKRGQCRNHYLQSQRHLGEVRSLPRYQLLDLGPYPALVRDGGNSISGELYEIDDDCLLRLDVVEGVEERLYERGEISLEKNPWTTEAITYFYLQSTSGVPDAGECWP